MNGINNILTKLTDGLLYPFAAWPLLALLIVSAVTGILMTWVFRVTSNQSALISVINRSQGHILAIKLFQDDLAGMFKGLFHVIRLAFARIWYSVVPLLVMIVPLAILLVQLSLRYEHRPLKSGESAIVDLQLTPEAWESYRDTQLNSNSAVEIETDPLRDELQNMISWRIRSVKSDPSTLQWEMGSNVIEKQLAASDMAGLQLVNRRRAGSGWLDRLLNPGEQAFDLSGPVSNIVVHYPPRETLVFGWPIPWWAVFFIVSMAFALLMQPVLKVKF